MKTELAISRLYNLSLSIDAFESDKKFVDDGGYINYVFDENLFELFVYPSDNWRLARNQDSADGHYVTTGMQSAILTAESLFGGELPGQVGGKIYITEWHRQELLDRMNEIMSSFDYESIESLEKKSTNILKKKFKHWQDTYHENDKLSDFYSEDSTLEGDLKILEKNKLVDKKTLLSFCRNRDMALILAKDKMLEPMQQLNRLLKEDLQDRLHSISSIAVPSDWQLTAIKKRAEFWAAQIREEIIFQTTKSKKRHMRNKISIWNDARSLAYIEWSAKNSNPNKERLVFVTGDKTIFDAYRRVFDKEKQYWAKTYWPFVIRKPIQYSIVFTNKDRQVLLREREELFYSIKQSIDLALVPLRINKLSNDQQMSEFIKNKYSLNLPKRLSAREDLESKSGVIYGIVSKFHKLNANKLSKVESEWRFSERMLIGLSRNILTKRLSDEEVDLFVEYAGSWGEDKEKLFSDYIKKSTANININALNLWKPIAERFIESELLEIGPYGLSRVPISVNIIIYINNKEYKLVEYLTSLSMNKEKKGYIKLGTAFDIFVASCSVALLTQNWETAKYYSELSIKAYRYLDKEEGITKERASEAYYLSALSLRFYLGNLELFPGKGTFDNCEKIYGEALCMLEVFIEYSFNLQTNPSNKFDRFYSDYRYNSERAALNLFYTCMCYRQGNIENFNKNNNAVDLPDEYYKKVVVSLKEAASSLGNCIDLITMNEPQEFCIDTTSSVKRILYHQTLINITALTFFQKILDAPINARLMSKLHNQCAGNIDKLRDIMRSENKLLFLVEILSYKMIVNADDTNSLSEMSFLNKNISYSSLLPIDAIMLKMIFSYWIK